MKKVAATLALLLTLANPAQAEYSDYNYDGDTLTLQSGERIRLACIDTPELRNNRHGKANKPAARAAKSYLRSLIANQNLRIHRIKTDRYGRTVARVFLPDGTDVSEAMVYSGHAKIYSRYASDCPWASPH